ncbi:MAG: hypothetical protein ABSC54_05330 [Smithellaceae bacterium]
MMKIRDGELYKEDGYKDFKSFIAGELKVGKTSVYNAIDLVDYFGVQSTGLAPYKLLPALPLLKADDEIISKADKKEVYFDNFITGCYKVRNENQRLSPEDAAHL